MRLRVAHDGDKYWLEEHSLLAWRKCRDLFRLSDDLRNIRLSGNPKYFNNLEMAMDFGKEWRRAFSRKQSERNTVYVEV